MVLADGWGSPSSLTEIAVALATLVLAVATWRMAGRTRDVATKTEEMARQTRRVAKETTDLAAVTGQQVAEDREAMEIAVRPVIVEVPQGLLFSESDPVSLGLARDLGDITLTMNDTHTFLELPFRNIGSGAAVIARATVAAGQLKSDAGSSHRVLPSHERGTIKAKCEFKTNQYTVVIDYSDVGPRQRFRTVMLVRPVPNAFNNGAAVESVEVFVCDEDWVAEVVPLVGPPRTTGR